LCAIARSNAVAESDGDMQAVNYAAFLPFLLLPFVILTSSTYNGESTQCIMFI
jgi:hypothetical protein